MTVNAIKYPQLAKMQEVQGDSHRIGEFLDWLDEQRLDVCAVITPNGAFSRWTPITEDRAALLARYFGIDLQAVENERRAVIEANTQWTCQETGRRPQCARCADGRPCFFRRATSGVDLDQDKD